MTNGEKETDESWPRTFRSAAPVRRRRNGKPRARRRRRGGGGGGGGGGGQNGSGIDREPADVPSDAPFEEGDGILELHPNGYGFLRSTENNYARERSDPFVPGTMIERFGLRQGVHLKAMVQQARRQQGPRVREILDVDGMTPEDYPDVKSFDTLTAINPEEWLQLGTGQQAAHQPRDRSARPDGQRPTSLDRRAAAKRQDDHAAGHRQRDFAKSSRCEADRAVDRRTSRRSDRHASQRARRRSHRQQLGHGRRKPCSAEPIGRSIVPADWPKWARMSS